MDTRWLTPEELRSWRSYTTLTELLEVELGRDLGPSGLSYPDYLVLVMLSEAERHRLRMQDLGAALSWSKSRLSHQLRRMEGRDLVTREDCPSDARGTYAVLAPAGLAAIRAAAPLHVASVRRLVVDVLTPDELASLGALSAKLLDRLRPR
ncbi:MarR family transcriptional regulator [Longispora fulva]|uniref:DNA-binding MarR family transcriptional regulator n=1 Tax=Longispora fulva TaxID=619741 RepID=A0A8J7GAG4_9ACTN|nr:MarR family transcriptional regulator [Longispora fulva]MBG6135415.1 DNA-binding MarR family transcriptional regulator [Longispora fulva]GIG56342.1 MarR family transcriptional regulator [Longispora fulva]